MPATKPITATIRAVRIHDFGGPEVLCFEDVPRPEPWTGETLCRVHAAGVNPVDWKIREGHVPSPLPTIMGIDFSGVVEACGPELTEFHVGDAVFGQVADDSGSYSEYAIAPASHITHKPEAIDHVHAAALPVAALTAWQALFDTAALSPDQIILIHASAGGVGGFAVQFAKWKGAHVIGTASADHLDFVRQLGADQVVDYRTTKFEEAARDVDVVLDTIGGETQERSWRTLKKGGILVSLVQPPSEGKARALGLRCALVRQKPRGDQLARIAELVVNGQVKIHVETVLPLQQARRAQELSQSGHAGGKIVLVVKD